MAYSSIIKPSDYFNTVLYTGNGSTNAITGVGFQPDWLWVKCRSNANGGQLFDVLRTTNSLSPNETDAEANRASDGFTSLDSDGFTMNGSGSGGNTNVSSRTYVAWNWLAANGTASNSNGSITSTVSANTTAGFSIVSYTGTGSAGTVGHGLGAVPKWYFVKRRDTGSSNWHVYHAGNAATQDIRLNLAEAAFTTDIWNDTAPTSTVFNVKISIDVNASGGTYIAYCFAEKKGYSKFGTYEGNANADGTFIYTGFKPALVIVKNKDAAENWIMFDNKRPGHNLTDALLKPNLSNAESTSGVKFDLLSNGFKARVSDAEGNSSNTFIYMAFAENPFVGNDSGTAVPVTAR
jgi:hypothetical protein